jgi:hypothetical protein
VASVYSRFDRLTVLSEVEGVVKKIRLPRPDGLAMTFFVYLRFFVVKKIREIRG